MNNQFQQHNKDYLDMEGNDGKTHRQLAIDGDYRHGLSGMCKCVVCGERKLTYPIMKFHNWDGARFTCYKCQGIDN